VGVVLKELSPLLRLDALTVSGSTLGEQLTAFPAPDGDVVHPLAAPLGGNGTMRVLWGSLAPSGAVIKISAASRELLRHRGPAVVFDDIYDLSSHIDDPDLDVSPESVLVLKGAGPRGAPGMPEWGALPLPKKLLERGVRDMVRISDARMSGTSFGTVVLHVAPESAVGGPLALVVSGDTIFLDAEAGRLDLEVDDGELRRRRESFVPPTPKYKRGYGAIFLDHVTQADTGCDFDILRHTEEQFRESPLGLLQGWTGGW